MTKLSLSEMKCIVRDRVNELIEVFEKKFADRCMYPITAPERVLFTKRGCVAGVSISDSYTGRGELNFNPVLMSENWEKFDGIVIHEVAHHCVFLLKGKIRSGGKRVIHGEDWKRMVKFLGGSDNRCHSFNVANSSVGRQRRWSYTCDCGIKHSIATVTHNRIRRGQRSYCCKRCNSKLVFVG